MVVTNLELTQATFEILAGLICLMIAIIIMMNRHSEKSMKVFLWMFCVSAILFFAESCAYIFRGNADLISIIINQACNFIVFLLNYLLANLFIHYIYSITEEKGIVLSKVFQKIADIALIFCAVLLVVNIFTGWMYYFDSSNYYHRNVLWYLYAAVSVFCLCAGCLAAIKQRKAISKTTIISLVLYAFVPIIAIVIQSYFYGIAITNLGIGIGVIIMLCVYLFNWSKGEYIDHAADEKKRKLLQAIALLIVMIASMSASIISCVFSIRRIAKDNSKSDSQVIAQMVGDSVDKEFLSPIVVAKTMANDASLKSYLKENEAFSAENVEGVVAKYLDSIRKGFGYQMVYAVSDYTKAYYTYDGISKFVDIENDEHDVWYKDFLASGEYYELNVDTDEANNWDLSVFVNVRVEDENNKLIGAVGVGVNMEKLQALIRQYEDQYGLDIKLVKKDGLVQVERDASKIEKEKVKSDYFGKVKADKFYYEEKDKYCQLTKYLENLDWYLVIKDKNPNKINVSKIIIPSVIIFLGGLFVMTITFAVINVREQKITKALHERKRTSLIDELTGLYNRHAYEEDLDSIQAKGNIPTTSIIVMDVNGLKFVNDNLGHSAGDELIIGAAKCMDTPFNEHGKVYRIGGDEFVAILNCSREKVVDAVATFDYLVSNWKGKHVSELAVSKGVVHGEDYANMTVREIIAIADKLMYEDKDRYYARTGKNRRK